MQDKYLYHDEYLENRRSEKGSGGITVGKPVTSFLRYASNSLRYSYRRNGRNLRIINDVKRLFIMALVGALWYLHE